VSKLGGPEAYPSQEKNWLLGYKTEEKEEEETILI